MLALSLRATVGEVRSTELLKVPQLAQHLATSQACCASLHTVVSNGFDRGGGKVFRKVFDNGEITVEELPIDTTLRPLSLILTQPDLLSLK